MLIDHIAIWVEDLEAMRSFYCTYFNCTSGAMYSNPQKGFKSYFISFRNGSRIELMRSEALTSKPGHRNNALGYTHIAIAVGTAAKVKGLTQRLQADGYRVTSQPRHTGDGYFESSVLDPEGNSIEIMALPDCKISKCTPNDTETILSLQKECYISEAEIYNNYSIQPLSQTLEELWDELKEWTALKLTYKDQIIGSVRFMANEGTCHIGKLIVSPQYQGMGYGELLLNAVENEAAQCKRFELFTGHKSTRNLNLYKKLGYKEFKKDEGKCITICYLQKTI